MISFRSLYNVGRYFVCGPKIWQAIWIVFMCPHPLQPPLSSQIVSHPFPLKLSANVLFMFNALATSCLHIQICIQRTLHVCIFYSRFFLFRHFFLFSHFFLFHHFFLFRCMLFFFWAGYNETNQRFQGDPALFFRRCRNTFFFKDVLATAYTNNFELVCHVTHIVLINISCFVKLTLKLHLNYVKIHITHVKT